MKIQELKEIIKEQVILFERNFEYASTISQKINDVKINGWEAEYIDDTGGIVWFNRDEKYMEPDDSPIWTIESSPFYEGYEDFDMWLAHEDTSKRWKVATKKIKPSENQKLDIKNFLIFFKKHLPHAEKMIQQKSRKIK